MQHFIKKESTQYFLKTNYRSTLGIQIRKSKIDLNMEALSIRHDDDGPSMMVHQ